jgi:hypothetical protein
LESVGCRAEISQDGSEGFANRFHGEGDTSFTWRLAVAILGRFLVSRNRAARTFLGVCTVAKKVAKKAVKKVAKAAKKVAKKAAPKKAAKKAGAKCGCCCK